MERTYLVPKKKKGKRDYNIVQVTNRQGKKRRTSKKYKKVKADSMNKVVRDMIKQDVKRPRRRRRR
jgi:hypothetical protein